MNDSVKQELTRSARSIDSIFNLNCQVVDETERLIDTGEAKSIKKLYGIMNELYSQVSGDIQKTKTLVQFKNALINYIGHKQIDELMSESDSSEYTNDDRTYEELIQDLNSLVGLQKVKSEVNDLVAFQKIQQHRKRFNLKTSTRTLHIAFMGNPGTGKTTVARIIGHLYKTLGLLSKGHFIEATRTDLIAGYQGQTAIKVKRLVDKAKGGVLFIDEAYSITENEHADSYGRECLTELTKALEDCREDLVVIVAGYTDPMKHFFDSNPGLKSRFNTFLFFEDYSSEELKDILNKIAKDNGYIFDNESELLVHEVIQQELSKQEKDFSNGRFVRNFFEDLTVIQARRLSDISETQLNAENLQKIISDDIRTYQESHIPIA